MTSVLNHHQLLSGSKIFFFLAILLFAASCNPKKLVVDQIDEPSNDIPEAIDKAEKDTIIEEIVISQALDTIKNPPAEKMLKRIVVILPFDVYTAEIDQSHAFVLHFYKGIRRAFESLNQEAFPLEISFKDSRKYGSSITRILDEIDANNTDLIIGGFSKNNIRTIAAHAKTKKIPYVSPIYPSESIVGANPYHIQVNPGINAHFEHIIRDVKSKYPRSTVHYIGRDSDSSRISELMSLYYGKDSIDMETRHLVEWEDDNTEFNFLGKFDRYNTNVIIIPSWSRPKFIYSVLRQINIDRPKSKVVVYGMPQWKTYDLPSYDYYESLDLHLTVGSYIEDANWTKSLRAQMYSSFAHISSEKELLAYATGMDIGNYFGKLLTKHGNSWLDRMIDTEYKGTAIHFKMDRINWDNKLLVGENLIDGYENIGTKMLFFENWKFQLQGF